QADESIVFGVTIEGHAPWDLTDWGGSPACRDVAIAIAIAIADDSAAAAGRVAQAAGSRMTGAGAGDILLAVGCRRWRTSGKKGDTAEEPSCAGERHPGGLRSSCRQFTLRNTCEQPKLFVKGTKGAASAAALGRCV